MTGSDSVPLRPRDWAAPRGYTDGIVASGRLVVLAGQIGWNPQTAAFETDDFATQVRQALANVARLLDEAGAQPRHLVRLTWFVTDRAAFLASRRDVGAAYRELFGLHYPPMSVLFVSSLVEERAKVEIEATAVLPD
ncbi:Endoribonuclease L-PSP (plasmid) [Gemmatirosa kalamazoonensis]|uniref:Endoribonuclease L-PSP n=1 Tax=Gemmatirosa kalamazoonensis TaxID=861299 RepID=W0RQX8_9BACT|nr:RidA family protein [Gemmatirosa kalamazoonensis]AHG93116.1 Endoribonuclease L-PSP [Gemmatirosa kalamazoonensis]